MCGCGDERAGRGTAREGGDWEHISTLVCWKSGPLTLRSRCMQGVETRLLLLQGRRKERGGRQEDGRREGGQSGSRDGKEGFAIEGGQELC